MNELMCKRLAGTNEITIGYHFLEGDCRPMEFKTKGKNMCDAINELMTFNRWQPFRIDTLCEE